MKKVSLLLLTVLIITTTVVAQNVQRERQLKDFDKRGYMGADPQKLEPVLRPDQKEAIEQLRLDLRKEMNLINLQIKEKRVQLQILEREDKPNLKKIDSKIDEITQLTNKRMKLAAKHRVDVRSILDDKQKAMFDSRMHRRAAHYNKGEGYADKRVRQNRR